LEAEQLRHEKLSENKHRQFTANLTDIVGRVDDLLDGLRTMQRRDLEFGTRVQEAFAMENAALLNENFQEARRAAREEVAELVDETVSRVARNLNEETRQQAIDAAAAAARNVVENSSSIIAAVDSAFQSRLNETVDAQVAAGLADVVLPEVVRLLRVERATVDAQLLDLQSSLSNLESLQINVSQLELLLQQVDNELTSVRDDVRTLESENDSSNARIRNISSELRSTNATLDELRSTVTDLRNYIDNDVSERVQAFVNNQQQLAIEQYDLAIRQTIDNLNSGILVRVDEVAQQVSEELRTIDTRVDSAVQDLRRELVSTSQSVVRQQEESNEDRDARITREVNELFNRTREYAKRIVEERQIEFKSAVDRMALSEDVESINATLSDQTASLRQQMNQNYSQLENRLVVSERSIGANEDALRQTIGDVAVVNDRTNRLDDQMRDQLRITDEFGNVLNQVRRTIPAIESRLANVESVDSLVSNQQMQISRVETIEREMIRLNNELSRPNVELGELDNRVVAIEESRQELERLLRNEQNQNAIVNRQLKELQDAFRVVRDAMDDRLATNSSSINNIIRELRSNRRSIEPSPSDNDLLDQMSSEINTLRITMGQFEVRLSELESTVNVSVDARINQIQRQLSTAVASSPIKRRRVLE
jgi:chromosome segregation ATPase